jgi:FixJ family two-component response regulator
MQSSEPTLVAVVDDDRRVLESLEALLESAGYAVLLYDSAEALLQSGALAQVRCLISDVRMPVTDGWQLESLVFDAHPALPVVLITGDELVQQEARFRATGRSRPIFKKPFNGPELLAAVRAALGETG